MRILSEATLKEVLRKYSMFAGRTGFRGNIVFRNAENRRNFYIELSRFITSGEFHLHRQGNVITFHNHNLIQLSITANRPTTMFDDILIDPTIDDFELLYNLEQHEYFAESERHYVHPFIQPKDLGELSPSTELLDYIGGLNGNQ